VTVKYNVEMAKDNDHEVQLPPDGPYRCSELCVHLTEDQTRSPDTAPARSKLALTTHEL